MAQNKENFVELKLVDLEQTLIDLKSNVGDGTQAHTSFSTHNVIMITSDSQKEDAELLDHLIKFNPARFFLLSFTKELGDLPYRISARCEILSSEDHICSEIIKIECAPSQVSLVTSILRSHLLTGVSTDVFILDSKSMTDAVVKNIVELSERVIYDSGLLGGLTNAESLNRFSNTRIDIQWLNLSQWREAVRMLFEIPSIGSRLNFIDRISIGTVTDKSGEISIASYFFAGWILGCLKLEVVAFGLDSFECKTREGRGIELGFFQSGNTPGPQSLNFDFLLQGDESNDKLSVELTRINNSIECIAKGKVEFRTSYNLKESSKLELLQRFFLAGTSVNQYDNALRQAVDLEKLSQGYRFS